MAAIAATSGKLPRVRVIYNFCYESTSKQFTCIPQFGKHLMEHFKHINIKDKQNICEIVSTCGY
jgi:hypothetical protein